MVLRSEMMCKRYTKMALILLLAGTLACSWVLYERKQEKKLLESIIKAQAVNKKYPSQIAIEDIDITAIADLSFDKQLKQSVAKCQNRKQIRELTFTASLAMMIAGSLGLSGCGVFWGIKRVAGEGKKLSGTEENPDELDEHPKEREASVRLSQQVAGAQKKRTLKYSNILANSGWCNADEKQASAIATLYCDETSLRDKIASESCQEDEGLGSEPVDRLAGNIRKTIVSDNEQNISEESLSSQTQTIEQQMDQMRQMTQAVTQAAMKSSEPLNNTISELAQQISAIREYASSQQEKIKKLQEGNEWKIIRTFCLRIIRSIDNLDKRIESLLEEGIEACDLEDIRDELIFALESSSVEQFAPEIESEYNGQEKLAEVVKDKEHTDNPDLRGKIAKVLRPGYQYIMDEGNIKVVRSSLVKLFA